ncbi:MAG: MCP four helix bundle domain-containing protein [Deltaproteobacteria bacterium]|nr:MCP four helix bundle domain-containing protein [Deltaproteobacteria bacterium]
MEFTIFKRLIFSYLVMMLFVIFLAGYMTFKLNQLNHLTRSIAFVDSTTIGIIERLLEAIYSQVSFEKKYLISKDKDFLNKFWEIHEYVVKDIKDAGDIADTPEKKGLFAKARQLYDRYISLFNEEANIIATGSNYSKEEYQEAREKVVSEINQKLRKIIKIARSDRDEMIQASSQTLQPNQLPCFKGRHCNGRYSHYFGNPDFFF